MSTANVRTETLFELQDLKGLDDLMREGLAPLEGATLMALVRDELTLFEAKPDGLLGDDGGAPVAGKDCDLAAGVTITVFSDKLEETRLVILCRLLYSPLLLSADDDSNLPGSLVYFSKGLLV